MARRKDMDFCPPTEKPHNATGFEAIVATASGMGPGGLSNRIGLTLTRDHETWAIPSHPQGVDYRQAEPSLFGEGPSHGSPFPPSTTDPRRGAQPRVQLAAR